jgi:hypothetical protein
MKKTEFKQLVKECIGEMSKMCAEDPDISLYKWIQYRLKKEWRPENIEALQKVAQMIEKEKGDLLKPQSLPPPHPDEGQQQ